MNISLNNHLLWLSAVPRRGMWEGSDLSWIRAQQFCAIRLPSTFSEVHRTVNPRSTWKWNQIIDGQKTISHIIARTRKLRASSQNATQRPVTAPSAVNVLIYDIQRSWRGPRRKDKEDRNSSHVRLFMDIHSTCLPALLSVERVPILWRGLPCYMHRKPPGRQQVCVCVCTCVCVCVCVCVYNFAGKIAANCYNQDQFSAYS